MAYVHITKDNFQELVLNSPKKVLLDFWAPWCGPCKMIAPVVEKIADTQADILVGKVNVDEQIELAMQFQVASIPTLLVFENGQVVNKAVGYMPEASILALLGK